jgi:hypothetical protein
MITIASPIIAGIAVAIVGYFVGVRKSRQERIIERRDTAIADVFGTMTRNYRACITWTGRAEPEIGDAVRERATRTS